MGRPCFVKRELFAALAVVALGLQLVAVPVAAALSSGISGTVRNGAGSGIGDVCVVASPAGGGATTWVQAVTAANGSYSISGLDQGHYVVSFDPQCHTHLPYALEYWNDKTSPSTADLVSVGVLATSEINATLAAAGSVSGTVTDPNGRALAGVCVRADDKYYTSATSDALGHYRLAALAPGAYHVIFGDCTSVYAKQWFNNAYTVFAATTVQVAAATDSGGINAVMRKPGTISGTVTERASGGPVSSTCIRAVPDDFMVGAVTATSDSAGRYQLTGLAPGRWRVEFALACSYSGYSAAPDWVAQYWRDTTDINAATKVDINDGDLITAIDARLDHGGAISGIVTDPSGAPLANVRVCLYEHGSGGCPATVTDANGHYRVTSLRSDDYQLQFDPAGTPYQSVYWHDAATLASATPIHAVIGTEVSGIDQRLSRGASLSGTVVDDAGQPVSGAVVGLAADGSCCAMSIEATSDASGRWRIDGIIPGRYQMRIAPDLSDTTHVGLWYPQGVSIWAGAPQG